MKKKERDELAEKHIGLVISCATQYRHSSKLSFADLFGEGCVGLLYAIDRFKDRKSKKRKVKFSTYAYWWIRRFILRAIEKGGEVVTVPDNIREQAYKWKKKAQLFVSEFGKIPDDLAIAKDIKIDVQKIKNVKKSIAIAEIPFDFSIGENNKLSDLIRDQSGTSFELFKDREFLKRLFQPLKGKEKKILKLYFGLDGQPSLTLAQIGKEFHLTRQRIHQIVKIAVKKLRKELNGRDQESYSEHS